MFFKSFFQKRNKIGGFSLVEAAVVLLIISTVVIVTVASNKIARQSEITSLIDDAIEIRQAVLKFKEIYGGWPGDLYDITPIPGTLVSDDAGNGDNIIDSTEINQFLYHLSKARLIDANISSEFGTAGPLLPTGSTAGTVYPSQIQDVGYMVEFIDPSQTVAATKGISLRMFKIDSSGNEKGFLTPLEVQNIIEAYDDGSELGGGISAYDPDSLCLSGGELDFSNLNTDCGLLVNIIAFADEADVTANSSTSCTRRSSIYQLGDTVVSESAACPYGYRGHVLETCTQSGQFEITSYECEPMTCYGGGIEGDTRTIACPAGYGGELDQTCHLGNWLYTDYMDGTGTFPCTEPTDVDCEDGQSRVLACPLGFNGYSEMSCVSGSWTLDLSTCQINTCDSGTRVFGESFIDTVNESCHDLTSPNGNPNVYISPYNGGSFSGGIEYLCMYNGDFTNAVGNDHCVLFIDSNTCSTAGSKRNVNCSPSRIETQGEIRQQCSAYKNIWVTIEDNCVPKTCGGAAIGSVRENTRGVICPSPISAQSSEAVRAVHLGQVVEVCVDNGQAAPPTWELDYSNCVSDLP